jgi:hypothetical protein
MAALGCILRKAHREFHGHTAAHDMMNDELYTIQYNTIQKSNERSKEAGEVDDKLSAMGSNQFTVNKSSLLI